jgi:hypothetical protein
MCERFSTGWATNRWTRYLVPVSDVHDRLDQVVVPSVAKDADPPRKSVQQEVGAGRTVRHHDSFHQHWVLIGARGCNPKNVLGPICMRSGHKETCGRRRLRFALPGAAFPTPSHQAGTARRAGRRCQKAPIHRDGSGARYRFLARVNGESCAQTPPSDLKPAKAQKAWTESPVVDATLLAIEETISGAGF